MTTPNPTGVGETSTDSVTSNTDSSSNGVIHTHKPIQKSRRVRVYHLQTSGSWCDWGIGWCFLGDEIPVGQEDPGQRTHILIQQETDKKLNANSETPHAPVGALGMPTVAPALLTLHVPDATGFSQQGSTIICYTTNTTAQHHRNQLHQIQTAGAAGTTLSPTLDGSIDIALSFQNGEDTREVWDYVHTFPEILAQEAEEQERQALEEADDAEEDAQQSNEVMAIDVTETANGREEQSSPRSIALMTEEQLDDFPPTHIATINQYRGDWSAGDQEEEEIDELTEPTNDATQPAPVAGQPRFFSNSNRPPPKPSNASGATRNDTEGDQSQAQQRRDRAMFDRAHSIYNDEDDDDIWAFHGFKNMSDGVDGKDSKAPRRTTQPETPSESEEEDGDDIIFPVSLRVPTMENIGRIHSHVDSLLHPPNMRPNSLQTYWDSKNSRRMKSKSAEQSTFPPVKRRHIFIGEITSKSLAFKRSSLQSSARRPVPMRARGMSPASQPNGSPATSAASTSPAPSTALTVASSATPPIVPPASPGELNWLENLAALMRAIDEEIMYREEHGVEVRPPSVPPQPPTDTDASATPAEHVERKEAEKSARTAEAAPQPQSQTASDPMQIDAGSVVSDAPSKDTTTPSAATADARVAASVPTPATPAVPTSALPLLTPRTAGLPTLLYAASRIQGIVSMLFAFNVPALLTYLFDYSSKHSIYYQWSLVLTAYEYEAAEDRKMKHLQAVNADRAARGEPPLTRVNSSALWQKHRSYLRSVVFKSPFPLQLTHVIDIPAFNQAVASGDPALIAELQPPNGTKFGLLVMSSHFVQYVRDTFLYSPRTLDDPIQMQMNQQVVNRHINLIMNGLIRDGETSVLPGANAGPVSVGGLRRTQATFRGTFDSVARKKSLGGDEYSAPTWPRYVFGRISQLIESEESKYGLVKNEPFADAVKMDDAISETKTADDAASSVSSPESPVPAGAAAPPLPGVYPFVSRLTSEWCSHTPFTFCETLADYIYALHHIVGLTKNSNTPNGVTPFQKDKFFNKLLQEGFLQCIEKVLLFCKHQQQRIQSAGGVNAPAAVPHTADSNGSGPPLFASSLSSMMTLTWLRLLCLDFLTSLQAACPGFMRTYMQAHVLHYVDLARVAGAELTIVQTDQKTNQTDTKTPMENRNKYWKAAHEKCRSTRLQLGAVVKTHAAHPTMNLEPLEDSLLMMCFQLMVDSQCYIGIRQIASSLIRLCLDPEFGRPAEQQNYSRFMSEEQNAANNNTSNPLVSLLALGGVGSSAAKQMHYDSENDDEDEGEVTDRNPSRYQSHLMQAFGKDGRRARPLSVQDAAKQRERKKAEAKRRRKSIKQRVKAKQSKMMEDTLLHLCYAQDANAMQRIIDVLRAASDAWAHLQSTNDVITPSQLARYTAAHPPSLLIDAIDFLSFFSLRHSIVFQEFVITAGIIDLLAAFFPRPKLTEAELEKEKQRVKQEAAGDTETKQEQRAHELAARDVNRAEPEPSPSPSPTPSPPSAITSAKSSSQSTPLVFQPPRITAPNGVLCAALRFVRIALEVDPIYAQPILSSNFLFYLVELLLQNLRPNLLHSAILEVFLYIDLKRIHALIGQLLEGNQYVSHMHAEESRKRQAKLQAKVETEAKQDWVDRTVEPSVKSDKPPIKREESIPMQIDSAPNVDPAPSVHATQAATVPPSATRTHTISVKTEDVEMTSGAASGSSVPILPAAPEHHTAPVMSTTSLLYPTAAYGISRVYSLPIWPRMFKWLRARRPKRVRRGSDDGVTEVAADGSPSLKRRRENSNDEDGQQPEKKRMKLSEDGADGVAVTTDDDGGAAFTDVDSPSSSHSDDSDFDSSSPSTSDSEAAVDGESGRRSSPFEDGGDDDTTTMEDSGDGLPQGDVQFSIHGEYINLPARHAREREREQDESYFDSWPDDPPAEQKQPVQGRDGQGKHGWMASLSSSGPTRYYTPGNTTAESLDDENDEDIFGPHPPSASNVVDAANTATAAAASVESAAAEKRMAEFEAQARLMREQKAASEQSVSLFTGLQRKTSTDGPGASSTTTLHSPVFFGGGILSSRSIGGSGATKPISFAFGSKAIGIPGKSTPTLPLASSVAASTTSSTASFRNANARVPPVGSPPLTNATQEEFVRAPDVLFFPFESTPGHNSQNKRPTPSDTLDWIPNATQPRGTNAQASATSAAASTSTITTTESANQS